VRRGEAGVPVATIGVDDPEVGPAPGRTESIAGDEHLDLLSDDIPTEAQPGTAGQLEAQPDRFPERAGHGLGQAGRLEDDEKGAGPTRERGQPMEPVGETGRSSRATGSRRPGAVGAKLGRQVDQEQIDRAPLEERARHREALVDRCRREHHEPFEAHAAGDRLDRIERLREVEVGHDRTALLRLGGEAEGERGLAAGVIAAERDAGQARDATRPEDRVQRGEARRDDPTVLGGGSLDRPIVERTGRR
jgi:hypothetical protein